MHTFATLLSLHALLLVTMVLLVDRERCRCLMSAILVKVCLRLVT